MRKLLFALLGVWRQLLQAVRWLSGVSDADRAAARVSSGEAWSAFCRELEAAGANLMAFGAPTDPLTQAEGYRYLSRLTRAGLEAFVEHRDPGAPVLARMVHETVKMGADNPDNLYFNAVIDGRRSYRLHGRRGSIGLLTFSTQRGTYGEGRGMPPAGHLDSTALTLDAHGGFEIVVGPQRPESGDWLPTTDDAGLLIVRQTFIDRAHEVPAELHLEPLDGPADPAPLTPAALEAGLRNTANLVAGASFLFAKWAKEFQGHTNQLPQFDPQRSNQAGGDPKIAYYHSYWRLAADEALVIEVTPPPCLTWNFQLNNHWMESLDYRYFRIHVNAHTATYEADGSVRIVVAHEDPHHPNWLQTVGHPQGTMCFRWFHAAHHPAPQTRVVKLADLRAEAA
jgi:hypothetical protein